MAAPGVAWASFGRAAEQRLDTAITDLFMTPHGRLDDRTRWAVLRLAEATVRAIEQRIAGHAARTLAARGQPNHAATLESNRAMVWPRLRACALMDDADLIGELIAQARMDLIDEALAALRAPDAGPTLLSVLAEDADPAVRDATIAYLVAESRRRLAVDDCRAAMPAVLHRRLSWWVAAALRERLGASGDAGCDQALSDAAQHAIMAHDGEDDVAAAANRLVAALRPGADALPTLLLRALDGARSTLFVALLGDALGIGDAEVRELVLDAGGERLWTALRAAGLARGAIARIGFALTEADPRRDLEALVEGLDSADALAPAAAAQALASLTLPRDYRSAVHALARRPQG